MVALMVRRQTGDMLATCIVLGAGETGSTGVIVDAQGSSLGMRVTARPEVAEFMPSGCWEPSSSVWGQDPRVTDGDLLGLALGLGLKCQAQPLTVVPVALQLCWLLSHWGSLWWGA